MSVVLCALVSLAALSAGAPPLTLHDLESADSADTMSVGSYIREVRAAAPEDYHKTYENEGDGEIGYSRKKEGGGKKGYQHFDAYHKAAGDHYEFEKADSFGHEDEDEKGAHSHPEQTKVAPHRAAESTKRPRNKRQPEVDDEASSEATYGQYEEPGSAEQGDEPKKKKKNKDEDGPEEEAIDEDHPHYEELKEGASDGNGGVEATGHDPADYQLPEKYSWEPEEF